MNFKVTKETNFEPITITIEIESQKELDEFYYGIGKTKYWFGEKLWNKLADLGAKIDEDR